MARARSRSPRKPRIINGSGGLHNVIGTAELEYDWGRKLRVSVIRGAVPADLMRIEADDQGGGAMYLEIPLSALRELHATLERAKLVATD